LGLAVLAEITLQIQRTVATLFSQRLLLPVVARAGIFSRVATLCPAVLAVVALVTM
jgi:hypothetical protein